MELEDGICKRVAVASWFTGEEVEASRGVDGLEGRMWGGGGGG